MIRREGLRDHWAVEEVHAAAFGGPGLDGASEVRLIGELRSDGDVAAGVALVAFMDQRVVGHVVCSRGHVGGRPLLGLGPLGVLPAHQGGGVGSALMHAVLVLGDLAYYRRFGFTQAAAVGLLPPVPAWTEHFLLRRLTAWDGSHRGTYRYAPPSVA